MIGSGSRALLDTPYLLSLEESFCDDATRESGPIGARMRVTIAHSRSKQEAKDAVERSIDHVFTGFNHQVFYALSVTIAADCATGARNTF